MEGRGGEGRGRSLGCKRVGGGEGVGVGWRVGVGE